MVLNVLIVLFHLIKQHESEQRMIKYNKTSIGPFPEFEGPGSLPDNRLGVMNGPWSQFRHSTFNSNGSHISNSNMLDAKVGPKIFVFENSYD